MLTTTHNEKRSRGNVEFANTLEDAIVEEEPLNLPAVGGGGPWMLEESIVFEGVRRHNPRRRKGIGKGI